MAKIRVEGTVTVTRDGAASIVDWPDTAKVDWSWTPPTEANKAAAAPGYLSEDAQLFIKGAPSFGWRNGVFMNLLTNEPYSDNLNEPLPSTWPGAPASVAIWDAMSPEQQAASMAQQVAALRQFQFDHNLFTDRIVIDGLTPDGFQPMEGAPFTRRFTTAGGTLRLEPGQPTTVGRPEAPPTVVPSLPPAETPPVVGTLHVTFGGSFDYPMRACDSVLIDFDVPKDRTFDPKSVGWFQGVEFPGNPQQRTIAVSINGTLVIPGTPPGIASPSLTFTVGNHDPQANLADINVEPGDHVALLVQSYGPADQWGGMRFQFNVPR